MNSTTKNQKIDDRDCSSEVMAASNQEPYANKLDIRCVAVRPGYSKTEMTVTSNMENLFGCAHGGAVFSLMDEAFQVACNSYGISAYALNVSVTYVKGSYPGDQLTAEANEIARTRKTATYAIEVRNGEGELVAHAQALAYRTGIPAPFATS